LEAAALIAVFGNGELDAAQAPAARRPGPEGFRLGGAFSHHVQTLRRPSVLRPTAQIMATDTTRLLRRLFTEVALSQT